MVATTSTARFAQAPATTVALDASQHEAPEDCGPAVRPLRIAYVMSRFPKITETFILFEMLSAERHGATVEVYPLWRERTNVMHDEARAYVARAHFLHLLSWAVLASNLKWFCRRPKKYLATLWTGLRANWGSSRYLAGFVAAYPKAIAMGDSMRTRGIDHVHAHFASHPAAAALVIHQMFGLPYSFTAHGSDLHRDQHMLQEKVRSAAMVVAISNYNREVILGCCDPKDAHKVAVIHCGTDTGVFQPCHNNSGKSNTTIQLTCIGTLHEVKGQAPLIEACALVRQRNLGFQLNLVGDGPDEESLKQKVADLHLQDTVIFQGRRTRREVAQLLAKTDIVVAPSVPTRDGRREGIPVALMEAMACGVPVVASRLSGIPELVEDDVNGKLVASGDILGLAAALESLIREPETRFRLGQAARETIEQRFDQHRNAGALLRRIRQSHAIAQESHP